MSAYVGTFAGYLIAFINADFYFILVSSHFVSPANALSKSTYLRVCFRFDKGGTGNIQERTLHRFPAYRSPFCRLLAALFALGSWTSCDLNPLTPIFCYLKIKVVTFIHEFVVTKNLREATLQAYPNPHQNTTYILKMSGHTQSELSHVSSSWLRNSPMPPLNTDSIRPRLHGRCTSARAFPT